MKCNVGKPEGVIRILLGIGAIVAGIWFKSWWGLVGIPVILTGMVGWCPVNYFFGLSTCKQQKQ